MSFESGNYSLKPGPVIGVGGMYATGNGLDNIVTLAAEVPSTAGRQVWEILAVEGKENVYTIILHTGGSTYGGSWSLRDKSAVPYGPIVTAEGFSEWRIQRVDNGLPSSSPAISIQPVTEAVGESYFVVAERDLVVVKPFPIDVEQPPFWQTGD
ncbi:hypothetical protein K443DRAFT_6678 [Laccaria amethystina LaAM-08-1]|uniref:Uncharacterized protein n=1 Tax=Laccaria amethystina LaAM-08-1 TaxID=1095629 RepID=A0A0C9XVU4_9AGAR|nr:hypothetical protein K443DRAFT_6678 [Laccaria amethystina LaAM-08-1]